MTTIGTPLAPSATRLMLLGSGELGKEVLIEAQRLGLARASELPGLYDMFEVE